MLYQAKPLEVSAERETPVKECSETNWKEARNRQVAASVLRAAATAENEGRREASLILPRRGGSR